ncbi:serine protease, partial [Paraconexibacter sp.]|uniref:serine protease n=1 Tax=Paraconexibacter sp. TaxID=2949640 RepID=UPI00356598CB
MPVKARLTGLLMALCCGALLVGGLAGAQGRSYQPRVVGGTAAPADGRFDAVARILIDRTTQCTGTLVAPRYVLTAAHCVYRPKVLGVPLAPAPSVKVTLGTTRSDGAGGTAYDVDAISIPPEYDDNDHHDVALLRLTTTASQAPVKVAGVGAQPLWAPGVLETVAGFGATSEGGSSASEMQVAQVPIIDDATCRTRYGTFENATQICAGYPQGGIDTCQGDSGGPLFGSDANGAFKLVGATSYGDGCARPGSPGVYARVADTTLREWIRSIAPAAIDDAVA